MSVDILGTSCDQCRSMVQYSITSTETRRLVRMDSPGRPPRLSHSSWTMLGQKEEAPAYNECQLHIIIPPTVSNTRVSRFGLAGKRSDLGSNPLRLSFLFKSCGLWTLSCDFIPHNCETLKWLSSLPTLMQESFWWWQCSDRYIFPLPPPPCPLPPFSTSLISLMVSVDVKHHVYLLL